MSDKITVYLTSKQDALRDLEHYFHVEVEVNAPYSNLDSLMAKCQTHTGYDPLVGSYAWEVGFHTIWADAAFCKKAAPVLRRVERRLDKWRKEFGPPTTFGGYVSRFLKIVKPHDIVCRVKGDPLEGERGLDPKDACYVVDRAIDRFLKGA